MDFEDFIAKVEAYPHYDLDMIRRAYAVAEEVHRPQKRKSGEPYIIHPIAVANIIFEIGGDDAMICAALLHDTLEDAEDPKALEAKLEQDFSKEVYYLVHALSKDGSVESKEEQQSLFFQQMEQALKTDISVFFLKMADLIHNLQTIGGLKQEKKQIWLSELKETYIPMFQDYYHQVALPYHHMYFQIMEELEKTLEKNAT